MKNTKNLKNIKKLEDVRPSNLEARPTVAFNFGLLDTQITLAQAREYHLNYLKHGPHVVSNSTGSVKKVSSLLINRALLEVLYNNGPKGVRLYFCSHTDTGVYLNIIAVPVKNDDDIEVRVNVGGNPPIVNTLEPCPSVCPKAYSENDLNSRKKGGLRCWYDANEGKWIKLVSGSPVEEPTEPTAPFDTDE